MGSSESPLPIGIDKHFKCKVEFETKKKQVNATLRNCDLFGGKLTSVISWNNSSGMVIVVMLCLTAVCSAFRNPTITGFLVLMVDDFTLSSTTR